MWYGKNDGDDAYPRNAEYYRRCDLERRLHALEHPIQPPTVPTDEEKQEIRGLLRANFGGKREVNMQDVSGKLEIVLDRDHNGDICLECADNNIIVSGKTLEEVMLKFAKSLQV